MHAFSEHPGQSALTFHEDSHRERYRTISWPPIRVTLANVHQPRMKFDPSFKRHPVMSMTGQSVPYSNASIKAPVLSATHPSSSSHSRGVPSPWGSLPGNQYSPLTSQYTQQELMLRNSPSMLRRCTDSPYRIESSIASQRPLSNSQIQINIKPTSHWITSNVRWQGEQQSESRR